MTTHSDLESLNATTQPLKKMPVFGNWEVVAKGWYIAARSSRVKRGKVISVVLCEQRIALFRGKDGKVRAIDAYCPHMGVDLSLGRVVENELRCFFHHWKFNGKGECTDIPCQKDISPQAKLHGWAVEEKYGLIWIYPDLNPDHGVPCVAALDGHEVVGRPGKVLMRKCHHHINMVNGIDPQHLRTVHNLDTDVKLEMPENTPEYVREFTIHGKTVFQTPLLKFYSWMTVGQFRYSMRFVDGTIGCISVNQNVHVRFLNWTMPELHMIFAYTPIKGEKLTRVQTIHVTRARKGTLGRLLSHLLVFATDSFFRVIRDEDGMIYDNIRFRPGALLPMDAPITQYMAWVNRLQPSVWSRNT